MVDKAKATEATFYLGRQIRDTLQNWPAQVATVMPEVHIGTGKRLADDGLSRIFKTAVLHFSPDVHSRERMAVVMF